MTNTILYIYEWYTILNRDQFTCLRVIYYNVSFNPHLMRIISNDRENTISVGRSTIKVSMKDKPLILEKRQNHKLPSSRTCHRHVALKHSLLTSPRPVITWGQHSSVRDWPTSSHLSQMLWALLQCQSMSSRYQKLYLHVTPYILMPWKLPSCPLPTTRRGNALQRTKQTLFDDKAFTLPLRTLIMPRQKACYLVL